MDKDKFEKFVQSVDSMVRIAEDNMLEHEDYEAGMSRGMWLREMATVYLVLPRRVGKTSYINKRAKCADLVIVHNHEMKKMYQNSRAQVVTWPELNTLTRGRSHQGFNRVYVDEPRMVFTHRSSVDDLYSFFCGELGHRVCANMFIMLGT